MFLTFKRRLSFFFTRLFNFEYWPFAVFYIPMYFYGFYLAVRSGSFMYFSTANLGMKYGGVMGVSKSKVLSSIPSQFLPKTIFITRSTSLSSILKIIENENFEFPFIIKPDVGERGKDVEMIRSKNELKAYLVHKTHDLNIQEYIDYDFEFGILYYRFPNEKKGRITSIVQKGFLSITGDGKRTMRELIANNIRANTRLDYLNKKFRNELEDVLIDGEKRNLEPIGNHCRGTTFYNGHHLIDEKLEEVFDKIAYKIQGYNYGRFDIKVPTLDDLYNGKNIIIIELNGVSSEVAHIYDPKYKLIQAYKDIAANMKIIYLIAKKNHALGNEYDHLGGFLKNLITHLKNR